VLKAIPPSILGLLGLITLLGVTAAIAASQVLLILIPLLLWGIALWIFRIPPRAVPPAPLGVLSPVDGSISEVGPSQDSYLDREALRIVVEHGPLDNPAWRSVTEGTIKRRWFAHELVETRRAGGRTALWIQTDESDDVVVAVDPSWAYPAVSCWVQSGERLGQGKVCGFAGLRGSVELYLPANVQIRIREGSRVRAGEDILASLVHG
jgi:phosphatidylserine decarboxylase